jgi:hypothetical protein
MSVPGKDGAWVTAAFVVRYRCTKCGEIEVTRFPQNEQEVHEFIVRHLRKYHGGVA